MDNFLGREGGGDVQAKAKAWMEATQARYMMEVRKNFLEKPGDNKR